MKNNEIVIYVEGGMVQGVMSTDPNLKVWIADRDDEYSTGRIPFTFDSSNLILVNESEVS